MHFYMHSYLHKKILILAKSGCYTTRFCPGVEHQKLEQPFEFYIRYSNDSVRQTV
jgi:hypothetical protein